MSGHEGVTGTMTRRRGRAALLSGLLLGGLLLAGCSGGGSDSAEEGFVGGEPGVAVAPESEVAEDQARAADGAGVTATDTGSTVLEDRSVIYRVALVLEVEDVTAGVDEASAIAARYGGYVQSESTSGRGDLGVSPGYYGDPETSLEYGIEPPYPPIPPDATSGVVVLRVPAESYSDVVSELEALGETVSRTRTADDVTDQVVDVETRIETQEASIDRLQQLLSEASRIADILAIETELTMRIAELESLQARLEQLNDLTDLATVTVTFYPPETVVDEGTGFVAGLRAGWDAFLRTVELGLTALGALTPFVAALALVAVPLVAWLVVRHRRGRSAGTPADAQPSPGTDQPTSGDAPATDAPAPDEPFTTPRSDGS